MTGTVKETDKEVLKRIMSGPDFQSIREAAAKEHAKRKEAQQNFLKEAAAGRNDA